MPVGIITQNVHTWHSNFSARLFRKEQDTNSLNCVSFHLYVFLQPTRHQWQTVFYIAAFVYAFGLFFFLFFGSGTEQEWNRHEHEHPVLNIDVDEFCDNPSRRLLVDGTENHP